MTTVVDLEMAHRYQNDITFVLDALELTIQRHSDLKPGKSSTARNKVLRLLQETLEALNEECDVADDRFLAMKKDLA